MRGTRWLILLAMMVIVGGSGYLFLSSRNSVRRHQPPKPAMLPENTNSTAINYEFGQSTGGSTEVTVRAQGYRQIRDTQNFELTGLELRLMRRDHQHYDLIKSAKAEFNQAEGHMYSDGDVEITLDVPLDGKPLHRLTSIRSSGINFDSKSGKAVTDRPAHFTFENGDGKSLGVSYDPSTRELHLVHEAELDLHGKGPHSKPMRVQAGEILYKEKDSVVWLFPWSRMERAETTIDAAGSIVNLRDGEIDSIDAQKAHGVDKYPKRELQYSADSLHVTYQDGEIRKLTGNGNARIHSASEGATTDTKSNTADLDFDSRDGEAILRHVLANGAAEAESKPAPAANGRMAETRVLKSNTIDLAMRPDGRNIAQVTTQTPGTLEFFPNAPDEHHRVLTGEHMVIGYADRNVIQSFQSVNVTTLTFPAAATRTKNAAPGRTASVNMSATFDGKGQLATMKQWERFTYEEGERRAKAETALLDNQTSVMDLQSGARIWDASGTTDADTIHMQQKTGDYIADGHVMTSRMPDQDPKKKSSGEMLNGDEPVEGTAPHMTSANHNKLVHYDGGAVIWQGGDRIQADSVDIDRDKHLLVANGKVVTQFLDEEKKEDKPGNPGDKKNTPVSSTGAKVVKVSVEAAAASVTPEAPPAAPVYTVVVSDKMVYTDEDRQAHYFGNVVLTRPGLHVKGNELRAFLNPKDAGTDSRLNHAVAEQNVEIVDSRPDRQRTGRGEHGEYFTDENKLILRGNLAELIDSVKGDSHGVQLTYYTSDDRLIINGAPAKPVTSHLKRKPHANANTGNR